MNQTIGIQGGKGSYHEQVAKAKYPQARILYIDNFPQVFNELLVTKSIDTAIVAIANNRYGFIQEAYNEILDHAEDIFIIDEYTLSVKHQLLTKKGTSINDITAVYSQNAAIGQCSKYIANHLTQADIIEYPDTATSAELVAHSRTNNLAAIASEQAAKEYDLNIVASDIQDDANNLTRFLIIQRRTNQPWREATNKTAAILTTGQEPGSLANCLNIFKEHSINITNLHSAFIPNTDFEMKFFIEFDSGTQYQGFNQCIEQIRLASKSIQIIGSYNNNMI
ncbi:hypothetical protein KC867_02755 [Candidatus Saccharibacteria bacterium]|nr:hypothetical protein [Candidatus Saccharibacteria bacterium]